MENQKESPYKLYNDLLLPSSQNSGTKPYKIKEKNKQNIFTLGDVNSSMDSLVDPEYNFCILTQ